MIQYLYASRSARMLTGHWLNKNKKEKTCFTCTLLKKWMFGRKNLKRSLFDNLPWFHNYEGDRIMIKLEEVYCACSSRWKQPCVSTFHCVMEGWDLHRALRHFQFCFFFFFISTIFPSNSTIIQGCLLKK